MARPTPLPAPVITAVLFINYFSLRPVVEFSELPNSTHCRVSADFTAAAITVCARAVMKAGGAGTLIANCVHKLPRLIVAEGNERIALARITRRPGQFPKLTGNFNGFKAGSTNLAGLELVPIASDKNKRALAAIDFHVVETPPAFIATACELAAFQHTGRAVLKLRENGDPIVEIIRLAATYGMPLFQIGHEPLHRADQQMREINAMTEHVAKFARAGELFDLPPAQVSRAPVLQSAGTIVIQLAQVAALHEVRQVAHRRHEPIGECAHVPYASAIRSRSHGVGVPGIQGQRLLAHDVFAVGNGVQGNLRVGEIRCGNDDGMDVVPFYNFRMTGGSNGNAGLLAGPVERGGVRVAQRDHFHVRTQGQTGQMILQGNTTATDDGKIERLPRWHDVTSMALPGVEASARVRRPGPLRFSEHGCA